MDDRSPLRHTPQPRVIRMGEFSRLGKSMLASAYERVVPITRVTLCGGSGSWPLGVAGQQMPARKAGA